MKTIACIGTGPSITQEQVDTARDKGFELYVCNNAYQLAPDAKLLYGCNLAWWEHYWHEVRDLPCEKWTTNIEAAGRYELNWVAEKFMWGLSEDHGVISHGHGSGFSLVSMAHRAGADRIVLLGYDLKYAPDYDGRARFIGSQPRHFFGEYPEKMQHWPSVRVNRGVHIELVELYRAVKEQGLVEIINCTPDSAIDCFERMHIEEL
jgi:predicted peroxiredoxin